MDTLEGPPVSLRVCQHGVVPRPEHVRRQGPGREPPILPIRAAEGGASKVCSRLTSVGSQCLWSESPIGCKAPGWQDGRGPSPGRHGVGDRDRQPPAPLTRAGRSVQPGHPARCFRHPSLGRTDSAAAICQRRCEVVRLRDLGARGFGAMPIEPQNLGAPGLEAEIQEVLLSCSCQI